MIRFQHMSMERVSFGEMDARKVDFLNVQWPKRIWNEVSAKSSAEFAEVEKMYRQLRHNYEDSKNYPDANRFYFGEMEMRRKKRAGIQRWFSLTQAYFLSSGYCTRPCRALAVWALLLGVFTAGFMLAGLHVNAAYQAEMRGLTSYLPEDIRWRWGWPLGWERAGLKVWFEHARYALLHVIEVASFSRYRHYTHLSGWGDALGVAAIVLIPLQLAMFVLAVRRAYKR